MKDKITATKIQQADIVLDPKNVQYELLIEETRKDETGVSYKYSRKETISIAMIEQEETMVDSEILRLQERKGKLADKKAKLI